MKHPFAMEICMRHIHMYKYCAQTAHSSMESKNDILFVFIFCNFLVALIAVGR